MQCVFLNHGLQIHYSGTVRPCCMLQVDQDYSKQNQVSKIDLQTWHQTDHIAAMKQKLLLDQWPKECTRCERSESSNRGDSMRLNGERSYGHYQNDDLVVELRPGNTCNFACQTCWPQASSRVASFYERADIKFVPADSTFWSYDVIAPVLHRIKHLIILGGEPFYDKQCRRFFSWLAQQNAHPRLTMFTNGSMIDFDFLRHYQNHINLVFSLDATGLAAEYVRMGTEWSVVLQNFQQCKQLNNVEVRVNITVSPYNYAYLRDLVTLLIQDWPAVVSWENAANNQNSKFMSCRTISDSQKPRVSGMVRDALQIVERANIEDMQRINSINALRSLIHDIETQPYSQHEHAALKQFIERMDRVKQMDIRHYCPEVADYLEIS